MREIKFQFIYKGLPFSSTDARFNWHKKVYSLDELLLKPLNKLSDAHGELIAKRQFTDLTDKNGVEIYDKDVGEHPCGSRFVVEWDKSHCSFRADYGDDFTSMLGLQIGDNGGAVIIGNIHQNPELLETNLNEESK